MRDSFAVRLFSWCGLFPLGAFLVLHVVTNGAALRSETAFVHLHRKLGHTPGIAIAEWLLVMVPMLVHGALGVWLVATRRSLPRPRPYPPAVRIAVRWTGFAVLAFLVLHLADVPVGGWAGGNAETELSVLSARLSCTRLSVPWRAVAYLLGAGCTAFHFAAGLWALCTRRRESQRARTTLAWAAGGLGTLLWVLFADVVVLHAAGAGFLALPGNGSDTTQTDDLVRAPCPAAAAAGPPASTP